MAFAAAGMVLAEPLELISGEHRVGVLAGGVVLAVELLAGVQLLAHEAPARLDEVVRLWRADRSCQRVDILEDAVVIGLEVNGAPVADSAVVVPRRDGVL